VATQRADTPEISEDASFQKREWKIQRVWWLVMIAIALAALAGVFGRGLVASARLRAPDGQLELEYDRVLRHSTKAHLTIRLPASSGEVGIWVDRELLEHHELIAVFPEPDRSTSSGDRVTYYFHDEPGAVIEFALEPRRIGLRRWRVGLSSTRSTLEIRCFVLP
jgi:hypothetical protein